MLIEGQTQGRSKRKKTLDDANLAFSQLVQKVADDKPITTDEGTGVPGRKDSTGVEKEVRATALKKHVKELEDLYQKKKDAGDAYKLAIKAVAEKSGMMGTVVAQVIKARMQDKVEDMQRETAQLALCFDQLAK